MGLPSFFSSFSHCYQGSGASIALVLPFLTPFLDHFFPGMLKPAPFPPVCSTGFSDLSVEVIGNRWITFFFFLVLPTFGGPPPFFFRRDQGAGRDFPLLNFARHFPRFFLCFCSEQTATTVGPSFSFFLFPPLDPQNRPSFFSWPGRT